jgi:hypothetical protein
MRRSRCRAILSLRLLPRPGMTHGTGADCERSEAGKGALGTTLVEQLVAAAALPIGLAVGAGARSRDAFRLGQEEAHGRSGPGGGRRRTDKGGAQSVPTTPSTSCGEMPASASAPSAPRSAMEVESCSGRTRACTVLWTPTIAMPAKGWLDTAHTHAPARGGAGPGSGARRGPGGAPTSLLLPG